MQSDEGRSRGVESILPSLAMRVLGVSVILLAGCALSHGAEEAEPARWTATTTIRDRHLPLTNLSRNLALVELPDRFLVFWLFREIGHRGVGIAVASVGLDGRLIGEPRTIVPRVVGEDEPAWIVAAALPAGVAIYWLARDVGRLWFLAVDSAGVPLREPATLRSDASWLERDGGPRLIGMRIHRSSSRTYLDYARAEEHVLLPLAEDGGAAGEPFFLLDVGTRFNRYRLSDHTERAHLIWEEPGGTPPTGEPGPVYGTFFYTSVAWDGSEVEPPRALFVRDGDIGVGSVFAAEGSLWAERWEAATSTVFPIDQPDRRQTVRRSTGFDLSTWVVVPDGTAAVTPDSAPDPITRGRRLMFRRFALAAGALLEELPLVTDACGIAEYDVAGSSPLAVAWIDACGAGTDPSANAIRLRIRRW